jgi:excisionase family DNA binding protein
MTSAVMLIRISLHGTKVGRHWRFHKDAIDAWIRDGILPT